MSLLGRLNRPIGGMDGARAAFIGAAAVIALVVPLSAVYLLQLPATPVTEVPPLGIAVAGVTFTIEPDAIRFQAQRNAGAQDRLDLWYLWPDLAAPDARTPALAPRLFVSITTENQTLPVAERLKSIYPHFAEAPAPSGFEGLVSRRFRDGTPYQHEEALYDASALDTFIARCISTGREIASATCLYERKVDDATLTFRFPREWLADWRSVRVATDRLLQQWRPTRS